MRRGRLHTSVGAAGIGLSIGAIAAYMLGQGVALVALGLGLAGAGLVDPEALDPTQSGPILLALTVAAQTSGLILAVALVRRRGVRLRPLIGVLRPIAPLLWSGVGLGLLAVAGSTLLVALLVGLSGSEATPEQVLTSGISETPLQLVLAVIAAVVIAPVAEELLFRGLLHRSLRRRLRVVPATAISSLVFALIHVDVLFSQPLAMAGLVLVGVVLALAYERTESLLVPIVIHAVYNAVTIVAVVLIGMSGLEASVPAVGMLRWLA